MIRTEVVVMPSKTKLGKFNIKQYLYVNQVFTPLKIRMGCRSGHPEHTGTLMVLRNYILTTALIKADSKRERRRFKKS